jgi:hypothetical protein
MTKEEYRWKMVNEKVYQFRIKSMVNKKKEL